VQHMKRLIAAVSIAGTLMLTAIPASATSNAYTLYHCKQWYTQMGIHGEASPQALHQVNLLATSSLTKHNVKLRAIALYATPNSAFALHGLDNACWTVPGMGP
jgi:hypothetical protein